MDPQPQEITDLQGVIQLLHSSRSSYCRTVLVKNTLAGFPDWDGLVKVFDLYGHPTSSCCFTWTYRDGDQWKTVAALNSERVDSPESAVQEFRKPLPPGFSEAAFALPLPKLPGSQVIK